MEYTGYSEAINIRISEDMYEAIEARRKMLGLGRSEYIRDVVTTDIAAFVKENAPHK